MNQVSFVLNKYGIIMTETKTYVFSNVDENIEVRKTGRSASQKIPSIALNPAREEQLFEITPVKMEDGKWKKFVTEKQLYEINAGAET